MKGLSFSSDLLLLKRPIQLVIVGLLVSAVWYAGIYRFQKVNAHSLQASQADKDALESKVLQLEGEERAVRGYIDRYRRLQARGVIGEERRLELVEALGRIRDRHHLYALQFDIDQQKVFSPQENTGQGIADGGETDGSGAAEVENAGAVMALGVSRMRISLPLLHEEDLTRFLEDLRTLDRGLFVVEQCELNRLESSRTESESLRVQENLGAVCQILWLTLQVEDRQSEDRGAEQ